MTKLKFFASLAALLAACYATTISAAPQSPAPPAAPQTITDADGYQLLARIVVGKLVNEQGSITYTVTPPSPDADLATRKAAAGEVLRDVVQKYNALHHDPEMYQVTETDYGFHVIARQFLNASGTMEDFTPILDTPVTIDPGQQTVAAILDEITQQLNAATGNPHSFTIAFPGGGQPTFLGQNVTFSASNEPARSVLDRLFKAIHITASKPYPGQSNRFYEVPASLSWQLNTWHGPNDGGIMFIYVVAPPGAR